MIRTDSPPPENPDWAARGRVCRNARVDGPCYRTQRDQTLVFGMDMVTLSKMENGKLDPSPLEAKWREQGG
jgi:hypothetical protein